MEHHMSRKKPLDEKFRDWELWRGHVDEEMSLAFAHLSFADCWLIVGLAILAFGMPAMALFVLNWG